MRGDSECGFCSTREDSSSPEPRIPNLTLLNAESWAHEMFKTRAAAVSPEAKTLACSPSPPARPCVTAGAPEECGQEGRGSLSAVRPPLGRQGREGRAGPWQRGCRLPQLRSGPSGDRRLWGHVAARCSQHSQLWQSLPAGRIRDGSLTTCSLRPSWRGLSGSQCGAAETAKSALVQSERSGLGQGSPQGPRSSCVSAGPGTSVGESV